MITFPSVFLKAFNKTVELEGGYSDDPHDVGGKTKFGVAWKYDKDYLIEEGITDDSMMKDLTLDIAQAVQYKKYWIGWRFHLLDKMPNTACVAYDFGFHEGKYGWMCVQEAMNIILGLNLTLDGDPGPMTQNAVNGLYERLRTYPTGCLNEENFAKLVDSLRAKWMCYLWEKDLEKMPKEKAMTYLNSGIRRLGRIHV